MYNLGGITCDEVGSITGIQLSGQQINGTLPVELAELSNLETLTLSWNYLSGNIPQKLLELQYLKRFEEHFDA